MPITRCQYIVTDPHNHKTRKCKNNHKWQIQDLKCCTLHYNYIYKHNAILIQRIFRGNKCRKKMKYFRLLDKDSQINIIKYMRKEYYDYKYNKSIANVILHKIDNFIKENMNNYQSTMYIVSAIEWYSEETESRYGKFTKIGHELFHIYGLLDKYYDLIKDKYQFYFNIYISVGSGIPSQSMYDKLHYFSKKIIYHSSWPQLNLEGLSHIDNFRANLPYIKNFNEKYRN